MISRRVIRCVGWSCSVGFVSVRCFAVLVFGGRLSSFCVLTLAGIVVIRFIFIAVAVFIRSTAFWRRASVLIRAWSVRCWMRGVVSRIRRSRFSVSVF